VRNAALVLLLVAVAALCLGVSCGSRRARAQAEPRLLHLPSPTGPAAVGTRSLLLVDHRRRDPFDPRHRFRRLIVQLWYPAEAGPATAAYLPRKVGRLLAQEYRLPPSTFARVGTNSIARGRPIREGGPHPLIIFSPGYGVTRDLYSTLFEELASHGFAVLALDHTYETEAVEFPNGTVVRRSLPANPLQRNHPTSSRLILKTMRTRVADVQFLLRRLPWINRQAAAGTIDLGRIGIFGHSLGGLTSAAIAGDDPGVRAAADLDGSIYGPETRRVASQAFMIMTERGDGTMARYWSKLRRPRFFVQIEGARHLNFSDWTVLAPWLRATHRRLPAVGPIAPARALTIVRAYLLAFFERYVADQPSSLLDQPSPFPEVKVKR
jgi:dienelactone hydrolase